MIILFLTTGNVSNIDSDEMYAVLLRHLRNAGHTVYIATASERRNGLQTELANNNGVWFLRVRTGNIKNVGFIEKGISTITMEWLFLKAIKKHLKSISFDLILYSTPPITFFGPISYLKKRTGAKSYLMLKDIFPQNAVDLGLFSKKSIIYRYFKRKEKDLYRISDIIGCMSKANIDYLKTNYSLNSKIVLCVNSLESNKDLVKKYSFSDANRIKILSENGIDPNSLVFVYGGNLGKPQGVQYLAECLERAMSIDQVTFVIVGDGSEAGYLKEKFGENGKNNIVLLNKMSSEKYNDFILACDVGLVFLDYRFTIPNYPSRILPYMKYGLPVLAVTDTATDLKTDIENGNFGWWIPANNTYLFEKIIVKISDDKSDLTQKGNNAFEYFNRYFTVETTYRQIIDEV